MWDLIERVQDIWRIVREERVPRLAAMLVSLIVIAATLAYFTGGLEGNVSIRGIGDALYWAVVTMATVGYGDIVPVTSFGRIMALAVIVSGLGLTALFTAAIASYFVEKRILEGKGMEDVRFKKHVIICGWNSRAMSIVERIIKSGSASPPLVFVNELPEEHIANVLRSCKDGQAKYVRGDFVHEGVLERANVREASVALLLIDTYGGKAGTRPDDRTALAAYATKGMNPKIRLCAEVENPDSIPHLKRAGVDMVTPLGGHNDFMMANAALSPGVTLAVQEILTFDRGHLLNQSSFPSSLIGKSFAEAYSHFRENGGGLLIGAVREEEEGMGLDDILSGDMTAVDRYIKKKFEGLENTYFTKSKRLIVTINPPDDYVIKQNDMALVISSEEKTS